MAGKVVAVVQKLGAPEKIQACWAELHTASAAVESRENQPSYILSALVRGEAIEILHKNQDFDPHGPFQQVCFLHYRYLQLPRLPFLPYALLAVSSSLRVIRTSASSIEQSQVRQAQRSQWPRDVRPQLAQSSVKRADCEPGQRLLVSPPCRRSRPPSRIDWAAHCR